MVPSGTSNPGVIQVRRCSIGAGLPKICVPVLGRRETEILASAQAALSGRPDLVEWRVDWFEGVEDPLRLDLILRQLRELLCDTPLLATFRSLREGGEKELPPENYVDILCQVINSGCADLADVELSAGAELVRQIVTRAHARGVAVVGSSHDFQRTPGEAELLRRLEEMAALGCDIAKIAVMPQAPEDVLTLLFATAQMRRRHPELPIITMSMGQLGLISRLCGEVFGSAVTFGSAGQASAPGQIDALELRGVLELLHSGTGA